MTGLNPIWGTITVYITSYLRSYDDTVTLSLTYIVFPISVTSCAIFMQVGAFMQDRVHPKIQIALGITMFSVPVILCSLVTSFGLFIFLYSIVLGFGYGITYMLPIKNAWLFYPKRKGTVSGLILCSKSIGSIAWSLIATYIANPNNMTTDLKIPIGNGQYEKLYSAESEVVANVPRMLCKCLLL